jgi:hypothetical protein
MSYTCNVDFPYIAPIDEFLSMLESYGSPTILSYQNIGPAGGNPNFTLQFQSLLNITNFLQDFYPESSDDPEFIDSLIQQI